MCDPKDRPKLVSFYDKQGVLRSYLNPDSLGMNALKRSCIWQSLFNVLSAMSIKDRSAQQKKVHVVSAGIISCHVRMCYGILCISQTLGRKLEAVWTALKNVLEELNIQHFESPFGLFNHTLSLYTCMHDDLHVFKNVSLFLQVLITWTCVWPDRSKNRGSQLLHLSGHESQFTGWKDDGQQERPHPLFWGLLW